MDLSKLKDRGFIPRDVVARMERTTPGALAKFLSKYLYDMLDIEGDPEHVKANVKTFVGMVLCDARLKPYAGLDDKGDYADARRALVEIRDFLEACALREVLK